MTDMHTRNTLISALCLADPRGTYEHMTLRALARTYYLMQGGEHPIEIAPWLTAYAVLQGRHEYEETLENFTDRAIFGR